MHLAGMQVWEMPQLWEGFIKCCRQTQPRSNEIRGSQISCRCWTEATHIAVIVSDASLAHASASRSTREGETYAMLTLPSPPPTLQRLASENPPIVFPQCFNCRPTACRTR